jgi:hypothetical protein
VDHQLTGITGMRAFPATMPMETALFPARS